MTISSSSANRVRFLLFSFIFGLLLIASTAKASPRVEIFVTSWCPYCKLLEKYLVSNQIPYTKYDIEKDYKGKSEHQKLGGGGVPVTRVDGETIIRGYNPPAITDALRSSPSKEKEHLL